MGSRRLVLELVVALHIGGRWDWWEVGPPKQEAEIEPPATPYLVYFPPPRKTSGF